MSPTEIVAEVESLGAELIPIANDRLRIRGVNRLTAGIIETLKERKSEIIPFLHKRETDFTLLRRFGPLSRHGRMCAGCRTINLVRACGTAEVCDPCLRDLIILAPGNQKPSEVEQAA